MLRSEKQDVVQSLREKLAAVQSLVLVDYRGIRVEDVTALRREFRRNGCEYKVVKNTLIEHAVQGTALEVIKPMLKGMTGLAMGFDEPSTVAKLSTKAAKDFDKFKVRGGYFDGKLLEVNGIKQLASMPSKDELRAQVLGTLVAPAQQIVGVLTAPMRDILLVLEARTKQLEATSSS